MTERLRGRGWITTLALLALLLAGAVLRLRGIDWDDGTHLHPDERFLTMVQGAMSPPRSFAEFLDTDTSTLNPRNVGYEFFVYGTWPMTIVHLTGDALDHAYRAKHAWLFEAARDDTVAAWPTWLARPGASALATARRALEAAPAWLRGGTDYGTVYLVGRAVSAAMDLAALLVLFAIGARLYDRRVGLLAAALGAFTAFHIQQSHFFTVDATTNFFVLLSLLGMVEMIHRRRLRGTVLAGIGMGMAAASKIAVWPLAPIAVVALVVVELSRAQAHAGRGAWRARRFWVWPATQIAVLAVIGIVTLRLSQPDMFVGPGWARVEADPTRLAKVTAKIPAGSWWTALNGVMPDALKPWVLPDPRWLGNMTEIRGQVTGHGIDWPPNHQWFGRTAFWFPWRNMVLWGMGAPLGLAAWLAWLAAGWALLRGRTRHLLPWLWTIAIFAYQGGGWVKTMRYFLVIYPTLTLLASWALIALWDAARRAARPPGRGEAEPAIAAVAEAEASAPSGWSATIDPEAAGTPVATDAIRSAPDASPTTAAGVAGDPPPTAGSPLRRRWHPVQRALATWARRLARPAAIGAVAVVLVGTVLWGVMFSRIYGRDHTRVAGSRWLYHNVPTAFGLTVQSGQAIGSFLPANHPNNVSYEGNRYVVDADRRLDALRVLVPGDESVTIDGAHIAWLTDPVGDAGAETFHAWLTDTAATTAEGGIQGVIAEGSLSVALSATEPRHVRIELPQTTLRPGGEYYLWLGVTGAPIAGRPSMLAVESHWDDAIPVGIDGYGGFDDAGTSYGEGMFGSTQLELYDEDFPDKVDRVVAALEAADYMVLTSNRVYGSVAQLPSRYPMTLHYYEMLFGGRLGYSRVADIHSYPGIGPIEIADQSAEEAWSVYDHPKVDVFEKTAAFDPERVRAELAPKTELRAWEWPSARPGLLTSLFAVVGAARADGSGSPPEARLAPRDALDLSPARRAAQRASGTWSHLFDADAPVNRQPWLAVVVWYLALAMLGVIAFPLVGTALDNLADRGWALSRTAGLLLVAWLGWVLGSTGRVAHTPALVWTLTALLALLSAALVWRRRSEWRRWWRRSWRLVLAEEVLFAALFALFVAIRVGNPDLWHPYYGGEKPMDMAYLNAVLRTVSFPPYDPWFAGGQMNYYYFGFVFVGALVKLTGIVPWLAYNLAVPSLAALTGLGVAGVAFAWARAMRRSRLVAAGAGVLAAVMAVVAGNLYQVQYIAAELANRGDSMFVSHLPGVQTLGRALVGLVALWRNHQSLALDTGHWYWKASRAIPAQGDVEPITEFPFFTFLYADLHAHMMALPITVLALGVALAWALPPEGSWLRALWRPGRLLALLLGALAIGALWPANTWDYPTYGLVAAGALAVGAWRRFGRPSPAWAWTVALQGGALLALSLLLFWPYHHTYVQPYSEFSMWRSVRTPLSAYLTVHGIFLFALVAWALVALRRALADVSERLVVSRVLAASVLGYGAVLAWLWLWSRGASGSAATYPPSPWTPALGALLLAVGTTLMLRPRARAADRFMAWLLTLGTALTMFVEYVVLSGDIGRMNTVFKFYIQVWVLWSVAAAVAAAHLAPWIRRTSLGRAWRAVMLVLVACGLVYTVTAAPAKIRDRFPRMDPEADAETYAAQLRPGLSGIAYQDYAVYDDDRQYLRLAYDRDAFRWLEDTVSGTPVVLEGFREKAYRWGSRYSIHTGLPTVIGWDWHQKQQRAGIGGDVVDQRVADVREMYDTADTERAWALLNQYGVDYVVVGEMERAFYAPDGIAKFDRMVADGKAAAVYRNPGVTLYRLERQ